MGRFHLGHLPLVREAFPTAQCFVREDAFLFPTTDAALSYYGSGLVDAIVDLPAGGEHRARLLALESRDGDFRQDKLLPRCEGPLSCGREAVETLASNFAIES